ncbi:hypothetical protein [Methylobacterium sp. NEAU K]|uniref:hypothetical protein n=1 Tax=Methylobacterium sp. NEAU K TaxID=3064946 RepID=UPI0027358044|nr:hypothetical protein [Methylobacterium sp. NEAU K]MDP4006190.1 hypothetical protein [Methylobacterium sp. NEAU K]
MNAIDGLAEVSAHDARLVGVPAVVRGEAVEYETADGARVLAEVAWSEGGEAGLHVPSGVHHSALATSLERAA